MTNNLFYFLTSTCIFILCSLIGLFQNSIYSVLCLLLLILLTSAIFISLDFYYLGLTLIIIYGGALIILFLFLIITIMKNVNLPFNKKLDLPNNFLLSISFVLNLIFFYILLNTELSSYYILNDSLTKSIYKIKYDHNDIIIFSDNLFNEYLLFLILTIIILFFILISAIFIAKKSSILSISTQNYIKNINELQK